MMRVMHKECLQFYGLTKVWKFYDVYHMKYQKIHTLALHPLTYPILVA